MEIASLQQQQETLRSQLGTVQQELGAARNSVQAAEERRAAKSQDLAQAQALAEGLQQDLALSLEAKVCQRPACYGASACSNAAVRACLNATGVVILQYRILHFAAG